MEVLSKVTVLFTLVLALSLLIERFLEVLKALYDLLDSRRDWYNLWTRQTTRIRDRVEKRMRIFEYVKPEVLKSVLKRIREMLLSEQGDYSGTVPVLSGDLVRAFYVRLSSKIVGIGVGIGLAFWMGIDLVTVWKEAAGESSRWAINISSENLRVAISGIVLGLGSSPVHKIITTIERMRERTRKKGGKS